MKNQIVLIDRIFILCSLYITGIFLAFMLNIFTNSLWLVSLELFFASLLFAKMTLNGFKKDRLLYYFLATVLVCFIFLISYMQVHKIGTDVESNTLISFLLLQSLSTAYMILRSNVITVTVKEKNEK